ncbi:hypothetical protein ILUMI_25032 [Ignelater luminosus]|uniref:CFA20 domain-containing protein n=1 Tax=Ignelater luminosus TaxID=2038154 RepID=A0A8K0C950_IGNLU|nr:hypothetical protein ILUMI_25032 [Ignelater luminosus]
MFSNAFQSGFISVFYSVGSNPLSLWDKSVRNGHIRRVVDDEVKSLVLELSGTNVATTYITCPIKARASLGIKLPFLVMVVKNMKKYFTFEIQVADDKDMRRRFRVSNFQSTTKVRPFCTTMPIGLSPGWNQIQFNLADFTRRAYGSTYLETVRVQIHANARIRRIYFSDRLYGDDEMPHEFKLFLPIPGTHRRQDRKSKETEKKPSIKDAGAAPASIPPHPSVEVERVELIEEEIPTVTPPATPVGAESPPESPAPPEDRPEEAEGSVAAEAGSVAPTEEAAGEEEVGEGEQPPPEDVASTAEGGEGGEEVEGEGASPAEENLSTIAEESPPPEEAPPPSEAAEGEGAEAAEATEAASAAEE